MKGFWADCRKWVNSHIQESCRWQASPYLPNVNIGLICLWFGKSFLKQLVLCYFFYQNWIAVPILFPLTGIMMFLEWQAWRKKILFQLEAGFKEWIYYIKSGLSAGNSVESTLLRCRESFAIHIGNNHPLQYGLNQFYRNLSLQIPVVDCMHKLGEETRVEVIEEFAVVFAILQRQGGETISILEKSIRKIYDKIELRQELNAMIAARQTEQRIMCTMPFAILFFVGKAGGGYFNGLYHNIQGVCIMTVCMIAYLISVRWGQKITEFEDIL